MDKYKKFGFRTNERIEEYLDELCRLTYHGYEALPIKTL